MKEKLLVLAKAMPEISSKYEQLVCVAGITDNGEWRRIYPIPWKIFWKNSEKNFKKKSWIEYDLQNNNPSDYRPESRKIKFETIKQSIFIPLIRNSKSNFIFISLFIRVPLLLPLFLL